MRLWSIHPQYLDRQGLLACWREGLLAKAVLGGKTVGYRNHPQLLRFKQADQPIDYINAYLWGIADEADQRGYCFNQTKLTKLLPSNKLSVTTGQIQYEWSHFLKKVATRNPGWHQSIDQSKSPIAHPLFDVIDGPIESWERLQL